MTNLEPDYKYIIALLKSTLRGETPPELPAGLSFADIYKKACFHKVVSPVFYAIEKLETKPEPELYKKWSRERDISLVRDMQQCHELELLKNTLNENKIRFIALKGSVMKSLYPQSDIRYMCDIDILVDDDKRAEVKDLLIKNGYEIEHFNQGVHDSYCKKPIMNIEVHKALFSEITEGGKNFHELFKQPFECSVKVSDYGYELNHTYFFLHLVTHAAKHYIHGGIGLRAFMDIWVYYDKYQNEIDMSEIERIISTNRHADLCMNLISLSLMWFGNKEYDKSLDETANYVFIGGAFGTIENQVSNDIRGKGKFKYLLSELFPSYKKVAERITIVKKCPVIYPFYIIWRLITKPFTSKKARTRIKTFFKS